ncbi:hypothetical protein ACFVYP_39250 [Kitasatospora sp. NPDC058201]
MDFRISSPATLAELAKARGNLHRVTDQVARQGLDKVGSGPFVAV